MKTKIEKRGIPPHQICYLVTLPNGVTNVLPTLRQSQKWAAREEVKLTKVTPYEESEAAYRNSINLADG